MKLNVAKCSFGVCSGKFLGFLVRGLEANSKKIEALRNIQAPTTVKEIQKLTMMIVALNKFISKCSDKCHPIFQTLKGGKQLKWTEECNKALANLKEYLTSPPPIYISQPHKQMYLYLFASPKVVRAAMIREEDTVQKLVYCVIKSLIGPKLNYLPIEKLVL